jgi:hypothetical protein
MLLTLLYQWSQPSLQSSSSLGFATFLAALAPRAILMASATVRQGSSFTELRRATVLLKAAVDGPFAGKGTMICRKHKHAIDAAALARYYQHFQRSTSLGTLT